MKDFINPHFSPATCSTEIEAFKTLLSTKNNLEERRDILPFFKERIHLSTYIGTYVPDIRNFDRIAYEYELWGDFSVDLVVGDSQKSHYLFVEFESGNKDSMFKKKYGKQTLEWSPALERGFSQVIDWFW
ncbi:unnamed protein product, partial [marine sediment metagenome]